MFSLALSTILLSGVLTIPPIKLLIVSPMFVFFFSAFAFISSNFCAVIFFNPKIILSPFFSSYPS